MRYYLSFATQHDFLGACIVNIPDGLPADDAIIAAVREAHRRGCNPGGAVAGSRIPEGECAGWPENAILEKDWLLAHGAKPASEVRGCVACDEKRDA